MITKDRVYNDLCYMGITKKEFHQISSYVFEDNRRTVSIGSMCTGVFWAFAMLMSLHSDAYLKCRMVYIVALIANVICWLGANYVAKKNPELTKTVVTLFSFATLLSGIGIAYCQPDVRSATMIAFLIIVPVLCIKNTLTDIVMESVTIFVYYILCRNVIEPDIFYWGLLNNIIFSIAGILIGHVISKERCQRFRYAMFMTELAELRKKYAYYDQLTEIKNRRAFEEDFLDKKKSAVDVSVIMLDLNGLKVTNDIYGHDAGDELIKAAAMCLTEIFGADYIYRIGGDEFCVLYEGCAEEIDKCLESLKQNAAKWHGKYINGFTISYGYAPCADELDAEAVIKMADKKMYECKRQYYNEKGNPKL